MAKDTPQSPTVSNKNLNIDLANTSNVATTPTSPNMGRAEIDVKTNEEKTTSRTRKSSQHSIQQSAQQKFSWNAVVFMENPLQPGKKIMIDRKSWITKIDDKMQSVSVYYGLDPLGYPKNPMGRTGVRGRGALPRYGPNHEIMAIVTRWKKQKNRPIFVERRVS